MKSLLILLIFSASFLSAEESWDPEKNPASLTRTVSSFTEPSAHLEIKAEYPGRLETFDVKEGKTLASSGSKVLLASQDSKLAQIEVNRAKEALKSEEKNLLKRKTEKKILKREVDFRLLELKRLQNLAKKGTVSKSNLDKVQFDYDNAVLKVEDLESAIQVQTQAIAQRKVALEKAEEDLSRYKIYAPKGWVLNERIIEPGTWVNSGEPIARLVNIRELSFFFRLSEKEAAALKKYELKLKDKRTGMKLAARIHHVDLTFDPVSRKKKVEIRVKSADFNISSGIEVELSLNLPYPKPAVKIPSSFVFKKFDQEYVKSSEGREIALIPLRRTADYIIINKSSLPEKVTLVKP